MAKIESPDVLGSYLNPLAHAAINAEGKKSREKVSGRRVERTNPFTRALDSAKSDALREAELAAGTQPSEERLQLLLDAVHETGEELKSHPNQSNILNFKASVRQFLHYIVENSYTVEERTSGVNILKRKKFTLIQVVDRKLEQLAAGILAGQTSQLEVLARVDEIAGLLVDIAR